MSAEQYFPGREYQRLPPTSFRGLVIVVWALALVLGLTSGSHANLPIPFRQMHEVELGNVVVQLVPNAQDGEELLWVGRASAVSLYSGLTRVAWFSGFLGNVTAIAAGDFLDRGNRQVAVATDNAGAVHLFSDSSGEWRRAASPIYLWSPILDLQAIERDDGGSYLAALSEQGELSILTMDPEEAMLRVLWRSGTQESIKHLALADLTGDGQPELVYARSSGYTAVLRLDDATVERRSERYPWGPILALGAYDRSSEQPGEVFAVTGEHTLYKWQWLGGELQLQHHFELEDLSRYMGWNASDGLWSSSPEGTTFWSITRDSLVANKELPGLYVQDVYSYRDKWLVRSVTQEWQLWTAADPDSVEFFVDGEPTDMLPSVHWHNQQLFVAMSDLASVLGLESTATSLHHRHSGTPVAVTPGERRLDYDEAVVLWLSEAPLLVDDVLFVPVDIAQAVGWDVEADIEGRTVRFSQRPDWLWLRSFE